MNQRQATERETILSNLKENYSYQIKNKLPKVNEIIDRIKNGEKISILVIHHYDMDGYGVRMVWMYLEKIYPNLKIEYAVESIRVGESNISYGCEDKFDYVIIGDLSIDDNKTKFDKLLYMIEKSNKFIMIDHHQSAFKFNKENFAIVIPHDEKIGRITSGALLMIHAFMDLIGNSYKFIRIIECIAVYDTYFFKNNSEISDEIFGNIPDMMNILFKYKKDKLYFANFYVSNALYYSLPDEDPNFKKQSEMFSMNDIAILNILIENREEEISKAEKELQIVDIYPYKVAIYYYSGKYGSEIGNSICTSHPEVDYMLMIDMNNKSCSLRCTKDIDLVKELLSDIPRAGGHPKACGFSFNDHDKVLEMVGGMLEKKEYIPNIFAPDIIITADCIRRKIESVILYVQSNYNYNITRIDLSKENGSSISNMCIYVEYEDFNKNLHGSNFDIGMSYESLLGKEELVKQVIKNINIKLFHKN